MDQVLSLGRKHLSKSSLIVCGIVVILCSCALIAKQWDGGSDVGIAPRLGSSSPLSSTNPAGYVEDPARVLIESIKQSTQLVAGDEDEEFDNQERDAWNRNNPCRSRLELMPLYEVRKYAKKLPPNPVWDELLTEYSKLHRAYTRKIGNGAENLTEHFLSGDSIPGCQFAVADVSSYTGLGNKLYVLVSSLLYAILTKRVILVPSSTLVTDITCEPFVGSSWALDAGNFPVPNFGDSAGFEASRWTHDNDFFTELDEWTKGLSSPVLAQFEAGLVQPARPLEHAVGVIHHEWQPASRFYCSAEQIVYSQVTWVHLAGCIYTIPKLFATPLFRPTLEAIFPDKMVITRLLRSAFFPSDSVWDRVMRINRLLLADADRRVGIQVRYKDGISHYEKMNDIVNKRIMNCSLQNGFLPAVSHDKDAIARPSFPSNNTVVKVFVASLFSGLQDHLSGVYVRNPTVTGEDVGLIQVSQDHTQILDSVDEDEQAFTEVLLLSFSDQLLVTPISTFGGLAQAYGALTPWFVEMREEEELPACQRGQTVDVCDQFTEKDYDCLYDPAVNKRPFSEVVPYVKDCLTIDHAGGIQLITDFES